MEALWMEEKVKRLYEQVKGLDLGLYLSGLLILVKDAADFIHINGLQDPATEEFRGIYLDLMNYDRAYWRHFGADLYKTLPEVGLPSGIAREAAGCNFNLSALRDRKIEKEWTRAAGWHFFKIYSQQLKTTLSNGKPLNELKAKLSKSENPKEPGKPYLELAERLAKRTKYSPGFWYPIMLYISLLLVETNFATLE